MPYGRRERGRRTPQLVSNLADLLNRPPRAFGFHYISFLILIDSPLPPTLPTAAKAVRETLAAAAKAQTRLAIPMQQGFFMPEDERREGEDEERGAEEDIVSEEEDEDGGEVSDPEVSSSEGEEGSGDFDNEVGRGAEGAGEEEDEEAGPSGRGAKRPAAPSRGAKAGAASTKRAKKAAVAAVAHIADDDDDDTGYGAEGLSWEAVLGAIQVGSYMHCSCMAICK